MPAALLEKLGDGLVDPDLSGLESDGVLLLDGEDALGAAERCYDCLLMVAYDGPGLAEPA